MTIIELENLTKHYGSYIAAEDISFTVRRGEIFGIIGPNGAGKTTTVECIEGLRQRDSGTIRICGFDPQDESTKLRELVGAQLQESQLPERLKVVEVLELFSSFYQSPADWRELARLLDLCDTLDSQIRLLSGGQQQRISIALAMIGNPEVVVLDELTTSLDPQSRREVWALIETIRDRGVTVLLVTHFMEEAERLCDRVALIDAGRLVAVDTVPGLIARVGDAQHVRFRPTEPVDPALLTELPGITRVDHEGNQLLVTGSGEHLTLTVLTALAQHDISVTNLRVEQPSLDDVFITLTTSDA